MFIMNNQFKKKQPNSEEGKYLLSYDSDLFSALKFLSLVYKINHNDREEKVPYEVFHMPEITESVDLKTEYVYWSMDKMSQHFHLCSYPFLFDAPAKTTILQTDQAIQMHHAMQSATSQGLFLMFGGATTANALSHFVVLNVTRENIVEDTIRELSQYGTSDLKKPLKVKFCGEEAEDAGGVRKEFFMLLLREILDPKYGMFKTYEESRQVWFSEDSFEGENMYSLIGVLLGLAIYNFTIIHLPFPLALYKKILKERVDLSDLKDLSPVMGNSMQALLDYDGDDMKDVFNLTFEISREAFGETRTVPLKPGGDTIYVTQENKKEFVDLYVDYVLNKSVENQFMGFNHGFHRVCGGRVLELFKAHELMEVVIGNEDYDWDAFESEAEYKGG